MSSGATKQPWYNRMWNALQVLIVNFPSRFKSESYNEQTGSDVVAINNWPSDVAPFSVMSDPFSGDITYSSPIYFSNKRDLTLSGYIWGSITQELRIYTDVLRGTDPVAALWEDITEDVFGHSQFFSGGAIVPGGSSCADAGFSVTDINNTCAGHTMLRVRVDTTTADFRGFDIHGTYRNGAV